MKGVRNVETYWKAIHQVTDRQLKILKIINSFNLPVITFGDLTKKSKLNKQTIYNELDVLIKLALVSREKRGRTLTVFMTRKGIANLLKWEKKEDLV